MTTVEPLRVLVVDDEANARSGLRKAIAFLGHDVRTASSGQEALAIHTCEPADVIITDWNLGTMPGDELCSQARTHDGDERYTYLVILTAYGDDEHRLAAIRAGADDFFVKPVDLIKLEARLLAISRVIGFERRRTFCAAESGRPSILASGAPPSSPGTGPASGQKLGEELGIIWLRRSAEAVVRQPR